MAHQGKHQPKAQMGGGSVGGALTVLVLLAAGYYVGSKYVLKRR